MQKLTGAKVRENMNGISTASRRRMKAAIELLAYTARWKTIYSRADERYYRYKLTFITLTLPSKQIHTDSEIFKKCLYPFLQAWAKRRPGLLYVCKAEVQDNDNIHFHITSNSFFHHRKLRDNWNKYVEKLGYVSRCSISNPNSTDVHSVKNVKSIAAYLTSYFTKKDLYKKPLKRFFKRHGRRLKALQEPSYRLPKNYFKNIKRKVTCSPWTASKPLLDARCVFNPDLLAVREDVRSINSDSLNWIMTDYVSIYPLREKSLKDFPQFELLFKTRFNEVLRKQYEIDKNVKID